MVALVSDTFERIRRLKGQMSSRAVAKRFGVHHSTVQDYWRRNKPPRRKRTTVTIESLGVHPCDGKCRRCGKVMLLRTLDGLCIECKLFDLQRGGVIRFDA